MRKVSEDDENLPLKTSTINANTEHFYFVVYVIIIL